MERLGEDLVLLSIQPDTGLVGTVGEIRFGLMGSELIRLIARGHVAVESGLLMVRDPAPTGDPELDLALTSITSQRRPPQLSAWVRVARHGILDAYLDRLASAGVIRSERRHLVTHWAVVQTDQLGAARASLDAVARSTGQVVNAEQAAVGGLAHATRLERWVYPDAVDGRMRQRLKQIARGQWASDAATGGAADAAAAADGAIEAAVYAVVLAVSLAVERSNP